MIISDFYNFKNDAKVEKLINDKNVSFILKCQDLSIHLSEDEVMLLIDLLNTEIKKETIQNETI